MSLTWREALAWATAELPDGQEGRWIVGSAAGRTPAELLDVLDDRVPARAEERLGSMIARRRKGVPLQYVLGRWQFRTLDLFVDERVLIPRPETEVVAEHAIACARRFEHPVVVDLGTGSGALALAVACEVPDAAVWATDLSEDALAVARANLAGTGRAATRVRLVAGSWFAALPGELRGAIHVVVANPPYVAEGEALPAEVADYEPRGALYAGPTGFEALEVIVRDARGWLSPGGALVCEIAPHQRDGVIRLAEAAGYHSVWVGPDLAGRDRVLVAEVGHDRA